MPLNKSAPGTFPRHTAGPTMILIIAVAVLLAFFALVFLYVERSTTQRDVRVLGKSQGDVRKTQ